MQADNLLINLGFNSSGVAQVMSVLETLSKKTIKLENSIKSISAKLFGTANNTSKAAEEIKTLASESDAAQKKIDGLNSNLSSLLSNVINYSGQIVQSFNAMINKSQALTQLSTAIDTIKTELAANLAPEITTITEKVTQWLAAQKGLITDGIELMIKMLAIANSVLGNTIALFLRFPAAILEAVAALAVLQQAMISTALSMTILWQHNPCKDIIADLDTITQRIADLDTNMQSSSSVFGDWQPLIDGIKSVCDWFNSVSQAVITLIPIFALLRPLFTALKPLFTILGQLAKGAFRLLFQGISLIARGVLMLVRVIIANPIVAVLVGLATVAYLIYKNWDWLKAKFTAIWNNILAACSKAWDAIVDSVNSAIKKILMFFGMSEEGADATVAKIGKIFDAIVDFIMAPFKAGYDLVTGLFDIWSDDTLSLTDKIGATFNKITDFLLSPFRAGWDLVKNIFGQFGIDIDAIVANAGESFAAFTDNIISPFRSAIQWVRKHFLGFIDNVKKKFSAVKKFFGLGDDSDEQAQEKLNEFNEMVASFDSEATVSQLPQSAVTHNTQTRGDNVINQGDITNNITIHTSDSSMTAKSLGDLTSKQIAEAHNNSRTAIGVL